MKTKIKTKTLTHPMGYVCHLTKAAYYNKRLALQMVDAKTGEPVCTITVNMPDAPLGEDEIHIKNYSANEGIGYMLMAEGIAEPTGKQVSSGWVSIPVYKINNEKLSEYIRHDA